MDAQAFAALHNAQLAACAFPPSLVDALRRKLAHEVFDAGAAFCVEALPDGTRRAVCTLEGGLAAESDVFLVDHAWTFRAADARAQLAAMPPLLSRVAAMAGVRARHGHAAADEDDASDSDAASSAGADSDDDVAECDSATGDEEEEEALRPRAWGGARDPAAFPDRVLASTWRLCGHYRLASADAAAETEATWYLVDEFGAAMRHSAAPTFALAPFLYCADPAGGAPPVAFSVAWPLRDVAAGEEATRDTLPGVPRGSGGRRGALLDCLYRRKGGGGRCAAALAAWQDAQADVAAAGLAAAAAQAAAEDAAAAATHAALLPPQAALPLRVWTDIDWVVDHLCRPEFCHVSSASQADVLWLKAPADPQSAAELGANSSCLLNQFPGEECLVFKHRLPRTAAAAPAALGPAGWLPLTFNATDELAAAAGADAAARAAGEQPLWIMKPWNLGRSMDATVAPCLPAVAAASLTGPKVCQRYVDAPALYRGRKFDVRVLVAVRRFVPILDALTWHEPFVRAANRAYTAATSALGDFQTQFTSMRQGGFEEEAVSVAQLAADFAAQGLDWPTAYARTRAMIRALLVAATPHIAAACAASDAARAAAADGGSGGTPARERCGALYGVDVMYDGGGAPKLLEVTFCPGVERPMASDALFFDKLFGCLFLARADGESEGFEAL